MSRSDAQLDELARSTTIDITMLGRTSGRPHRIEIWWFRVQGRFVITATPGRRDWLDNLRADPRLTIHVNGMDVEATASEIRDQGLRRRIFSSRETSWYSTQTELESLVTDAPMIELHF